MCRLLVKYLSKVHFLWHYDTANSAIFKGQANVGGIVFYKHQPKFTLLLFFYQLYLNLFINEFKGEGSETLKLNQNESISKTKHFGANFMEIGL